MCQFLKKAKITDEVLKFNPMKIKELLLKAQNEKESGNEFYKHGNIRSAIKKYHYCLMYLKDIEKPSPLSKLTGEPHEELSQKSLKDINNLRCTCYNNLSVCLAKKQQYDKVIEYTTKVLLLDSDNLKALFRRGQAYMNKTDFDKAEKDFKRIKIINEKETCADDYFILIEKERKKEERKRKDLYKKMVSGKT
ncbi:tetratricopeptide repeat protein 9C isoform X3 [Hydra vulgaris]|uniref:peptidylprolyl isomerase n=1 Tax=Hydra vulgaris TaxID=6087 RepID=A0ABM4CKF8_HYDVU